MIGGENMTQISKTNTYSDGDTLTAPLYEIDRNDIINVVNGGLDNTNIAAGAGIDSTKLAVTFPSGAIVGTTDSQTLTNKTLTAPTVNNPAMKGAHEAWVSDSDGTTITFDLSAGNKHRVTISGSRTLVLSNVSAGQVFIVRIQQGSGSDTVGWFGGISWAGGSAPTLTTTVGKADLFGFIQTGTNTYDGIVLGLAI